MSESMVPFAQMKSTILNTATKDALLFEDSRFSENQNNLVYLFTSNPNANYVLNDMTMYLGVHPESGDPIIADINSALDPTVIKSVFPNDVITWSIVWDDPALEATYSQFIEMDPLTGIIKISKPNTQLPAETKLKMVEFKVKGSSPRITLESPTLFFFDVNPAYAETQASDITLALTETNSISFYATWYGIIK